MNYYIYGFTDKGNFRSHNEDAMLIDHEVVQSGGEESSVSAPFLSAVCDGVGGEHAGEVASKLCLQYLSIMDYSSNTDLNTELLKIHNSLKKYGITHDNAVNMQTTLCCLAVDENGGAMCVNVGDSRMYRYVNGRVRQISSDQTYGRFLYEQGEINDIEELDPKMRSVIISSMGSVIQNPRIEIIPFITSFGIEDGIEDDDTVLICSDGASNFLSADEIEIAMSLDLTFRDKIEALCELALRHGSTDNISIIGIKPYSSSEEYDKLTTSSDNCNKEEINDNASANKDIAEEESIPQVAAEEKKLADKSIAELEKFISDLNNYQN